MAFGQGRGGNFNRGGAQQYSSVRLTGLFATKKPGLLVGTVEGEALDGLVAKIKEASAQGKGITLFFKEIDNPTGSYVAQVFADVDTREQKPAGSERQVYRKPIEADPAQSAGPAQPAPKRSYDPFGSR